MNYMKITSISNPKIKTVLEIKRRKRGAEQKFFIIEGPHLIEMALNTETPVKEIFFSEIFGGKREGQSILSQLSGQKVRIFEVADHVLNKITDTETPQGIVAVVDCRPLSLEELPLKKNPLLVVCDSIQDPGNLGTIIRTADAAGADAVIILPGGCDIYMPKVIRATAGSIFNIPVAHAAVDELLEWARSHKIKLAVTAADAGETVFDTQLKESIAFVFGNEAHGIQEALIKAADMALRIPVYGKAESLNVATSAAVCLYEAARQRKGLFLQ